MVVIGGPGYVQGPVIHLSHSCGHPSEMRCIETTRAHVDFMESGPCLGCYKAGLKPDARPALSLEDIEEEDAREEAGQLSIF